MDALLSSTTLPAINASLNACAAVLLLLGFYWVKRGRLVAHKWTMIAAVVFSAVFLACYLYYHFSFPARYFGGQGFVKYLYYAILITHIPLAAGMVPFILRLLYLAFTENFVAHKKLAKWLWPVWMYVSVTGVLIYFFLYRWYPT